MDLDVVIFGLLCLNMVSAALLPTNVPSAEAATVPSVESASIPSVQDKLDPYCARVPPLPLAEVNPSFTVYTSEKQQEFRLSSEDKAEAEVKKLVDAGFFQKDRQVVFIVHGYIGNAVCAKWMLHIKDMVLKNDDSTVLVVRWALGADSAYSLSASTTQTVAAAIAAVATAVQKSSVFGDNTDDMYAYCIGHSLGSHICGQAGRKAQIFDRITGLDPAGPGFEKCADDKWNINNDSAGCVDNIHTDGSMKGHETSVMYYGTLTQWGHVDFFVNGGSNQPACSTQGAGQVVPSCSHFAAVEYFLLNSTADDGCKAVGSCEKPTDKSSCSEDTQQIGYYSSCYKGSEERMDGVFYVDVGGDDDDSSKCKIAGQQYCTDLKGLSM